MGEGRNIDRFSTVIDRAATLPPQIKSEECEIVVHHVLSVSIWAWWSLFHHWLAAIPRFLEYPPVAQRVRRDEGAKSPIQLHGKEHHVIDEAHWRDRNFCYLPEE